MTADLGDLRVPFLLPLLVVAAALGWAALRHRRPKTPATVLVCVACEQSVRGSSGAAACPRCGSVLEDVRGFYDRHPERRGGDGG